MNLGIRAKLFGASVLLVLGAVVCAGLILESELRGRMEANIDAEIARHVRSARELVSSSERGATIGEIDELADRLGAAIEMRVTIIAGDGRVLGDSELDAAQLRTVENHGSRPEVLAAREHDTGSSRRYSTTLRTEMLYAAAVVDESARGWVVRVARPLSEVEAAIARLRRQMFFAGLIGLFGAALMSALASAWMVRALRSLARSARAIAKGERRAPVDASSRDEIGRVAGSLNELAESVESTVTELATERARFETVLEAMTDAVVALDRERRITMMNSAALELLSVGEDATGRPLVDIIRVPALQDLIAGGGDSTGSAELDLREGGRRVLARVTPQRGTGGWVLVMNDITALRRLETIRRDFVANVSHELRTPVSVVQANAETLLAGAADDAKHARPLLEALHRNAERMARLIADLLDLSRIEAGRYEISDSRLALRAVAARAVEAVERAAEHKDTTVEIDMPADLAVRADAKAVDQILVNFLDNAIKYTGPDGHVCVSARPNNGTVRIEVADDGPGIPEDHRARVFERFYRVDPGRSRDMGGTGLGLAIVRHLVEAMDGTVGVRAGDPEGAVFWVELPRAD